MNGTNLVAASAENTIRVLSHSADPIELVCEIEFLERHITVIQWYKDELPLTRDHDIVANQTNKYGTRGTYNLLVLDPQLDDAGTYRCSLDGTTVRRAELIILRE